MFYIIAVVFGAVSVGAGLLAESSGSTLTWILAIACAAWCLIFTSLGVAEENALEVDEDYDRR